MVFSGGRSSGKTFQFFVNIIEKKIDELKEKDKQLGNSYEYNGEVNGIMIWRRKKDTIADQIEILEELLCQINGMI